MAVNLSMLNLNDETLITNIRDGLKKHAVSGELLTVEITEGAMMTNLRRVVDIIGALDSMGVRITVDDFGTGFSSLSRLKELPVDELKIDKSFVIFLDTDRNDLAIVNATLSLARNLGLEVVAEGVESEAVWTLLKKMGCDTAQGYYISEPVSAMALVKWLRKREPRATA